MVLLRWVMVSIFRAARFPPPLARSVNFDDRFQQRCGSGFGAAVRYSPGNHSCVSPAKCRLKTHRCSAPAIRN